MFFGNVLTEGEHAGGALMGFRKSSHTKLERYRGQHRFEHWYRDNSVYFITTRVRDGFPAFESQAAIEIFWDRFEFYTKKHGFVPWIATLMNNHYHFLGYHKHAEHELGEMMRKLHGSVAFMVMKAIGVSHVPFWRSNGGKDYFDGCIRDVLQAYRAYNYVRDQAVKANLVKDYRDYPDTRIYVDRDRAVARAAELGAYLEEVPYARYEKRLNRRAQLR